MVVVAHEAIGIEPPVLLVYFLRQEVKEDQPVGVVEEDVLALVTPGGEVINGAVKFEAERAGHEEILYKG